MLSFLCLHEVMTWRHDVTKLISPISACRCSKMRIHMYFCRYFGWWVPNYYRVCTCMMFLCHDMTSLKLLHDVMKRTAFISACKCARELISFSFLWFLWWLNSTWLLFSYLHDGITSRNDAMTSLNMLNLSQLVNVLERCFFFSFYCILGCQIQNYHRFCIFICGHVTKWRYDVMAWLHDVTKLSPSILTCGVTRQMIRSLPVYIWW